MKVMNQPILVVEDDDVDVMTIQRAFKEIRVTNPVVRQENGEMAIDYLRDPSNAMPCIILLDLNMPVMSGIEFLEIIKADENLRRIPVIVLTTSKEQEDKINSFNFSVAGYMAKPVDYRRFVDVMRSIDVYWSLSELPG
ncbi:response regulator [Trinickia sp. Y13]|uniref:response regulator n=1 Tax=Trinickia sp. Y13 TaxID=2917807 RepID=UPI002405241A|nr:response regulator [Trinickia sp. Y13]MDG0024431.1 response regulator [Trinickia sp. Y13]